MMVEIAQDSNEFANETAYSSQITQLLTFFKSAVVSVPIPFSQVVRKSICTIYMMAEKSSRVTSCATAIQVFREAF